MQNQEVPVSRLEVLQWAAQTGDLAALNAVLTTKNANYCQQVSGVSLLALAAGEGEAAAVEVLLGAGADPGVRDADGFTALHRAVGGGHLEAVAALCDGGADAFDRGFGKAGTLLGLACQKGRMDVIRFLVAAFGAPLLDLEDHQGLTPLACATIAGNTHVVELLRSLGADATRSNPVALCSRSVQAAETLSQRHLYQGILYHLVQGQAVQSLAGVR